MREAYERQYLLKDEIEELEKKLQALKQFEFMSELSNKVTGKTLVSEDVIVQAAKPWEGFSGVYFLVSDGKIVYVGQSVNVYSRLQNHADKKFDSFTIIQCKKEHLDMLESLYIHMFKPPMNGHETSNCAPLNLEKILQLSATAK